LPDQVIESAIGFGAIIQVSLRCPNVDDGDEAGNHVRILCAPDSFKESLAAAEVAGAMARGLRQGNPAVDPDACPIGDGGEGTMDCLTAAMGGEIRHAAALDPIGRPIEAKWGFVESKKLAIVELAAASGLAVVPRELRDPMRTTTHGTGDLIRAAIEAGCDEIIVCIGGSATVDGGTGLLAALGWRFFDAGGSLIPLPLTGGHLSKIARIELPRLSLPRIRVACDVTNPLCGPNGAATVYGPQKGAMPARVRELDAGLAHFAKIAGGAPTQPGAGAAGGAGFGLATLLGATLERGIDLVLDAVGFDDRCRAASLVLTGEGRLDDQSRQGKACTTIAKRVAVLGVPTIAVVGVVDGDARRFETAAGGDFKRVISLSERFGREKALGQPSSCIEQICSELSASHVTPRPAGG